jgi:hypothetical protein
MSQATMALFGKAAGAVALAGFIPYITSTIRGRCRPARSTWFIWSLSAFLLAASYRASGARDTLWVALAGLVGPLAVFALSLKYHDESSWKRRDTICVIAALLSVIPWYLSHRPVITLVINLIVDFWGTPATWEKTWHEPEKEDKLAWALWSSCNVLNLFAIGHWTFAIYVFPMYFLIGTGVTTVLVFVRPHSSKR